MRRITMLRRITGHRRSIGRGGMGSGRTTVADAIARRAFSPVPMRVMDGSEPGLDTPAAVLSGAPIDLQARTVRYG